MAVEPPSIRALDSQIPGCFCFHRASRSYYLFFYYLSYYLYMFAEWSKNGGFNVCGMVVENLLDSHKPVGISFLAGLD